MHPKKIENLQRLPPEDRFDYFCRECADWECVWGLTVNCDNWVIFKDKDQDEIFPVWPHRELAESCMFEEHAALGARPQSISLHKFLTECIPDMEAQHVLFGVFYDKNRTALFLLPKILKKRLEDELREHFG